MRPVLGVAFAQWFTMEVDALFVTVYDSTIEMNAFFFRAADQLLI